MLTLSSATLMSDNFMDDFKSIHHFFLKCRRRPCSILFYILYRIILKGDSGGPLTYRYGGQHILIGDVSWGVGCGPDGQYGVNGRISYFRPWIEMEMKKLEAPKYCRSGPDAGV